ncbi:hypothetical protein EYD10_01732 [Varanus komodoensis]|nr:hypothetical protein EYD10_01732 [Varanus komodoensis]
MVQLPGLFVPLGNSEHLQKLLQACFETQAGALCGTPGSVLVNAFLRWPRGSPELLAEALPALLKTRKEKSPSSRPLLEIYSASGVLLASCLWKNSAVVQLGWTASEDLLCIQEDGSVLVYTLFCEFKRCFSLGNEVLQNHVLEAKVFHTECGTGLAVLTGAHRFTMVMNTADLKIRRLPEVPGLQKPPSCWTVLSQDRVGVILLAVGPDLYLLDSTACSPVVPCLD